MQRLKISLLAIFCIALFGSCSAQDRSLTDYDLCVGGVSRTQEGVLRICARLDESTLAEFKRQLTPQDSEIILTSGGGPSPVAMSFASVVAERGLTVRTRQFCLSACATYVLMTASKVIVEPYTIVAFHHTASFIADFWADRSGADPNDPSRYPAEQEKIFFQKNGLDPDLLHRLAMATEPECWGIQQTPKGREGVVRYRYTWFMPNQSQAEVLFRDRMSGYWPASGREAETILQKIRGQRLNVAFGWPDGDVSSPETVARTLPEC